MADPVDPVPPAPAPTPAPLKPGWQTSEAWLTLLTMIIGAIPSSGLTANSPELTKIIGLVVAALAAVNYTAQRTSLKRTYLAATVTGIAPQVPRMPQLAASALFVAVVVTVGISQAACGGSLNCADPKNAQSFACVVEGSVVDCTGVSSLPSAVSVVTPIVVKLIASARQVDGSINWPSIESQVVDLALQYGMCVVAEVWNDLMNGGGGGSGSAPAPVPALAAGSSTALPKLSSTDLAKEFDRIRSRVSPGRQFKTSGGTL